MEIIKKRNLILYISIAVLLVSVGFKVSYAFMNAATTGNDTVTPMNVRTGNLDINFTTSEYITTANKILLINDNESATKALKSSFSVTNPTATSTVNAKYDIYLSNITISNNLKQGDMKWELVKGNTVIENGTFNTTDDYTTYFKLTKTAYQTISRGSTDNYEFRLWLSKNNTDQTGLLSGSQFSAKIKVVATSVRNS